MSKGVTKLLAVLLTLLLGSCGGGGGGSSSTPSGMTPVTVSLGGVAAGALAPAGTIPPNVSKVLVDAISSTGVVIVSPPVILNAANSFTATVGVPNGSGIRIRARAFDAAGSRIYEGLSAPQTLNGTPVTVPIILSVTVAVTATPPSIPRGGVVTLTATTAGGAPTANSPLIWNATGGTLGTPGPNGATNTWTAPNTLGTYTIEAHVDPYVNPDQDPQVFGSVTVNVVNQLPVALDDTATTSPSSPVLIDVLANDSDPDGDPITIAAVSNPANGSAVISAGKIQYTPNAGFTGTDTFTYDISDGLGGVATATVTVTVNAIAVDIGLTKTVNNTAPASGSIVTFTVTATNNSAVSVPGIRVSDALPAGLSLLSSTPSQGSYAGGVWNVGTLAAGASATLSMNARVLPGNGGVTLTNTASLASIGVGYVDNVPANDSAAVSIVPTASADLALTKSVAGATTPGSTVTYTLSVTNAGPDTASTITVTDALPAGMTYVSDTGGAATTVTGNTVTWNIPSLANGASASIDILASIGALASNTPVTNSASLGAVTPDPVLPNNSSSAMFTVGNSLPVITSPATSPYAFTIPEDSPTVSFQLSATDADNDPLTYGPAAGAAKGSATVTPNAGGALVSYTPNPNANGADTFTVPVSDPYGASTLTVNVTITPVNDAPVFTFPGVNPYAIATPRDTYANFTAVAFDPDVGDTLTYSIYSAPANGNAWIDLYTGAVSYLGNPGFVGSDSFVIQVKDPYGLLDQVTVNVTVTAPLANIWYVDPIAGNDLNAGVDWYSAVQTINKAIQLASPGDEIRVAASFASENIVINKPNLTLIGGWDPYTNTLLGNISPTLVSGASPLLPVVDIQANGIRIEHLYVSSGFRGFQVDGYSAVLVDSWATGSTDVGLAVLNGASVDVYASAFDANGGPGIGAAGAGTVLNLYDVRMTDNYSEGLSALAGAQVNAAKMLSARNYMGVYAQDVGTMVNIDQGIMFGNMAVGALFDSYSGGLLKNTMIFGSSEDPSNPFPGSGCGVAAVGGAGNTASGAFALTLANVLAEGNHGCGIGVDAYSAMVANNITSIDNNAPTTGGIGSPNVYNAGQLTLNRSVVAYHSDGISTDVYTVAGSTTTISDSIIGQPVVGTGALTQTNVVVADPYAFRVVDAYGMLDIYAGQLPYLSQPTGGLPQSPAIDAGVITPALAGVAGLTTDIYGAVDAAPVDAGFHFPSGDLDQDIIPDAMENDPYGLAFSPTNPNNPDSDGDGYRDGIELYVYGTDPMDPFSLPVFQPQLVAYSDAPNGAPVGSVVSIIAQVNDPYTGAPLANEPVRFTIQTSPYATFTPSGLQTIDLYTDPYGQAIATLTDSYTEMVPVLVEALNYPGLSQVVNQPFGFSGNQILDAYSDAPNGAPVGSAVSIIAQVNDPYTGAPRANEPVRFTIQTSPYATFTPSGLQTIDLYTDAMGFVAATLTDSYAETVPVLVEALNYPGTSQTVNQQFLFYPGVGTVISVGNGNDQISGANCNTVWDSYGSPYFVQGSVFIAPGCRLQIDPYVIVKFDSGSGISAEGVLDVYGLPGAPVYFTSIKDDTVGGDTNGDGAASTPAPYDWGNVAYHPGSSGIMRNAEIRYGGGAGALQVYSSPTIDTVLISDSGGDGLYVNSGSPQVNNLTIRNTGWSGIYVTGTSAPVFTGTNSITGVSSFYPSIYLSTGVNATMSGFTVTGGFHGLQIETNASVTLTNSTIRSASGWGIYLNGAGVVTIKDNRIVSNGGGVYIASAAAGTSIENNLIRSNDGTSTTNNPIRIDATSPIVVRNNLIVENITNGVSNPGAILLWSGGLPPGPTVDLYGNTVAHNQSVLPGAPVGLVVDAYATVNAFDNIFAFNTDPAGSPTDTQISPLAVITEDYNLTTDASLAGANDIYADPLFTANWYLQAGSPAVNADASRTAAGVGYLNNNPYTEVSAADVGNLDLGYHHATIAPTVDAAASTVTSTVVTAGPGGSTDIIITPKDAANALLGAGLKVTAAVSPGLGSLGPVRDNGDGTYVVTHTHGAVTGNSDVVTITVNGVPLTTTATVSW